MNDASSIPEAVNVTIRDFPRDLLREIDEHASEIAGPKANPSRPKAMIDLLRRGLADAKRKR